MIDRPLDSTEHKECSSPRPRYTAGEVVRARGETWRVLDRSDDESRTLWAVSQADPDRDAVLGYDEVEKEHEALSTANRANRPTPVPTMSMEFSPTYFTTLLLDGLDLTTATNHYLDWIEGLGAYVRRREARARQGVPSPIDRAALLAGATISSERGAEVACRSRPREVLLRFIHRDQRNPEVHWYSVVRLRERNGDGPCISVDHGTGRSVPRHLRLPPVAGAPAVVKQLCGLPGVRPRSRDLCQPELLHVRPREADEFVRYILRDEDRSLPYLVVSAETATGLYLADPDVLARRLAAQVVVASLHQDATREFCRAFEDDGFSRDFGVCFDGAARLYHSRIAATGSPRDHYLWLPDRLRDYGNESTERLAAEVAERATWRALPPRFFSLFEDWDRSESRERADAVLRDREAESADLAAKVRAQSSEIRDLRIQLQAAQDERCEWEKEVGDYESTVNALRQRIDETEQERDEARGKAAAFSTHLERARSASGGVSIEQQAALRRVLMGRVDSLADALRILETLYADRVVVLPSAWKSAEDSSCFRKPEKAWELMLRLVEDYWDAVQAGGDAAARKVFTNATFAPRESESVEVNKGAKARRTFDYNGSPLTMWKHLKIGVKPSDTETFRLHFEFDASTGRIVIGHCGGHLDFK